MIIPQRVKFLSILLVLFLFITPSSAPTNEAEYYRGVYDLCVYAGYKHSNKPHEYVQKACIIFTNQAKANKWYNEPSKGWEWKP